MMNDERLMTAVRDSFSGTRMSVPEEQIISRGRAVRTRRRMSGLAAGSVAGVAAVALSLSALLPVGRTGTSIRLDAWTVRKTANGSVDVTIRQLRHPARLQAALRADGVPANVTDTGRGPNPRCRLLGDNESAKKRKGPASMPTYPSGGSGVPGGFGPGSPFQTTAGADSDSGKAVFLIIKPADIPAGVGLEIYSTGGPLQLGPQVTGRRQIFLAVVHASPACTGS